MKIHEILKALQNIFHLSRIWHLYLNPFKSYINLSKNIAFVGTVKTSLDTGHTRQDSHGWMGWGRNAKTTCNSKIFVTDGRTDRWTNRPTDQHGKL